MGTTSIRARGVASWQRKQSTLTYPCFFAALLLIILLSDCPVKLIASYDETTEIELCELAANMTPIEALTTIVRVLISLSVASERLVKIINGPDS